MRKQILKKIALSNDDGELIKLLSNSNTHVVAAAMNKLMLVDIARHEGDSEVFPLHEDIPLSIAVISACTRSGQSDVSSEFPEGVSHVLSKMYNMWKNLVDAEQAFHALERKHDDILREIQLFRQQLGSTQAEEEREELRLKVEEGEKRIDESRKEMAKASDACGKAYPPKWAFRVLRYALRLTE